MDSRTLTPSLALACKILDVGRTLSLLGGREEPDAADHVVLPADLHVIVALAAYFLDPLGLRVALPAVGLVHRPRPRERVVDHGHVEDERVGVALVEIDALFHNRLIVVVQRNAAGIESAWPREAAGLDLQQIELAVAVGVDPLADGIPEQRLLDPLGPGASVREDAPRVADVLDQNMRGAGRDHELALAIAVGDTRHAGRYAGIGFDNALAARGLVGEVGLVAGLVFRRQRRLLGRPPTLARIKHIGAAARLHRRAGVRPASPLAREIG